MVGRRFASFSRVMADNKISPGASSMDPEWYAFHSIYRLCSRFKGLNINDLTF